MRPMVVVVVLEIEQLVLQVRRGPEQHAIQILASNRADQPFHKGMGQGNIGNDLDFGHLQDPQIGLPLPKPIKWIMVGAEVLWHPGLPSNGAVEHPAKCDSIDGSGVDAEPNDPASVLIHDDQDPVVRNVADSHRNKSRLQRLSFRCPMKVNQDGPPEFLAGR